MRPSVWRKKQKPGVPSNHQLFSREGLPWWGPGRVPLQPPHWPSCADQRVVSGRHQELAGNIKKRKKHNPVTHHMDTTSYYNNIQTNGNTTKIKKSKV